MTVICGGHNFKKKSSCTGHGQLWHTHRAQHPHDCWPGLLGHQLLCFKDLSRCSGRRPIPSLEELLEALFCYLLLFHLPHAAGCHYELRNDGQFGVFSESWPEEWHTLLQGHRHPRALLPEAEHWPAADGVPVLWQQQLQGLVWGAVDQQSLPGLQLQGSERVSGHRDIHCDDVRKWPVRKRPVQAFHPAWILLDW